MNGRRNKSDDLRGIKHTLDIMHDHLHTIIRLLKSAPIPPTEQKTLDEILAIEQSDIAKIDEALK